MVGRQDRAGPIHVPQYPDLFPLHRGGVLRSASVAFGALPLHRIVGNGWGMGGGGALVMECWPERHRPKLAGAIGAASNVGFLFIGIVAWVSPVMSGSWRWLMLVGALPAVLALFVSLLVPESERGKAARQTAKSNPLREIFGPKLRKRTLLAIVFSSIALIGTWAAVSGWIPNWVEQMKQAELTETLLPESKLTSVPANELGEALKAARGRLSKEQWVRIESQSARAKAGIQIVLAIGAILACYMAPVIGGVWGRRPVYFGLCLLSLVLCACLFRLMSVRPRFCVDGGNCGGRDGCLLRMVAALSARTVPHAGPCHGPRVKLQLRPHLRGRGRSADGALVRILGGDYASAGRRSPLSMSPG